MIRLDERKDIKFRAIRFYSIVSLTKNFKDKRTFNFYFCLAQPALLCPSFVRYLLLFKKWCIQLHAKNSLKKILKLNNKHINNTIVLKNRERKIIINTRCIDSQNVKKSSSPLSREYYRILDLVAVKLPDVNKV